MLVLIYLLLEYASWIKVSHACCRCHLFTISILHFEVKSKQKQISLTVNNLP